MALSGKSDALSVAALGKTNDNLEYQISSRCLSRSMGLNAFHAVGGKTSAPPDCDTLNIQHTLTTFCRIS